MHVRPIHAVDISTSSNQIMTAGKDHRGGTYSLDDDSDQQTTFSADFELIDVAVHPEKSSVITYATSGDVVYVWDKSREGPAKQFTMPARYVSNVRFDPQDANILVATAREFVCSFDVTTDETIGQQTLSDDILGFNFSPNGHWLAAGHANGTVTLLRRTSTR